jgi:hypothetical protein
MNYRPRLALLLSSLLTSMSCGGEPRSVGDFIESADRYARSVCECDYNSLALLFAGKAPYESRDACLADLPANSAERGCVEGLFEDAPVDYSAVLDCRADAFARVAACLNSLTCTDTARGDCYENLDDEYKLCPDLPKDVEDDLNDCLYN